MLTLVVQLGILVAVFSVPLYSLGGDMGWSMIFLVASLICLILAAFNVRVARPHLGWLGMALYVASHPCEVKPSQRIGPLPEQAVSMRVEHGMLLLREILPPALYTEVRTVVCQWDLASEPEALRMQEVVRARWRC